MTYILWTVQVLLALVFVFAGGFKLLTPIDVLTTLVPLPGLAIRVVGLAEVLGGLGLILPGVLGIRPTLTPLAAVELIHVMLAATLLTLATQSDATQALIPLATGLLSAFVAYGRWRVAPLGAQRGAARRQALQCEA